MLSFSEIAAKAAERPYKSRVIGSEGLDFRGKLSSDGAVCLPRSLPIMTFTVREDGDLLYIRFAKAEDQSQPKRYKHYIGRTYVRKWTAAWKRSSIDFYAKYDAYTNTWNAVCNRKGPAEWYEDTNSTGL